MIIATEAMRCHVASRETKTAARPFQTRKRFRLGTRCGESSLLLDALCPYHHRAYIPEGGGGFLHSAADSAFDRLKSSLRQLQVIEQDLPPPLAALLSPAGNNTAARQMIVISLLGAKPMTVLYCDRGFGPPSRRCLGLCRRA